MFKAFDFKKEWEVISYWNGDNKSNYNFMGKYVVLVNLDLTGFYDQTLSD